MALGNTTWDAYAEPNITGLYDAFVYANSVTNDYFSLGLLIATFVIFFIAFKSRVDSKEAFASSSFIASILGGILRSAGLISDMITVMFFIMTASSMIILWVTRE